MHKVVIIDDEAIIVEGLTKILPWERWDCIVCGSADNGADGLELMRREKPAIVRTDIRMPQMGTCTLLKRRLKTLNCLEIHFQLSNCNIYPSPPFCVINFIFRYVEGRRR